MGKREKERWRRGPGREVGEVKLRVRVLIRPRERRELIRDGMVDSCRR